MCHTCCKVNLIMLLCVNKQGLVLFLGKLFFCMFLNLNNMILTHAKYFFVKKMALICQILKKIIYSHQISTTGGRPKIYIKRI
jgi:hypothetical protein